MFFSRNAYISLGALFVLYCCKTAWASAFDLVFWVGVAIFALAVILELTTLYVPFGDSGVTIRRRVPERMSCGGDNEVEIDLETHYAAARIAEVVDYAPAEFTMRDNSIMTILRPGETSHVTYTIRPTIRGEFHFGETFVLVRTPLNILVRRFRSQETTTVTRVFPAYHFIRSAQLLSHDNYERMIGDHTTRRIGNSKEFDTVRDYVKGDDYRTINWKATARRGNLMVNQYVDETRKTIFCVIDKGRGMQHAFQGTTLMDHSINAAVQLSYVAMRHSDDAGIVTFNQKVDTVVSPKCNPTTHTETILRALYGETSDHVESDYTALVQHFTSRSSRSGLLLLFTTIDSMGTLRRRLPELRRLASRHTLLVVFFEDEDMKMAAKAKHETTNEYILTSLAHHAILEKKTLVKELRRTGIMALLTSPERMTTETINEYLRIKTEGRI